jgi:hypothetical protein
MKFRRTIFALALLAVPAVPTLALAAPAAAPATGPVRVAAYTFNGGVTANGLIAENSGRGTPLRVRATNGAQIAIGVLSTTPANRYVRFPAKCATTATTCGRALLEGSDDPDLDPGTRAFRWGAQAIATPNHVGLSSNVMQKGVATTDSQWKLQIGGVKHRAQCVVVGVGSTTAYIAKSDIGVADGRWHSLACVRTATTLTVYVDGRARGQVAVPATLSITNNLPLRIGGANFGVTSDSFNGWLDNV